MGPSTSMNRQKAFRGRFTGLYRLRDTAMFTTQHADTLLGMLKKSDWKRLHPALLKCLSDFDKKVYVNFNGGVITEVDIFLDVFFQIITNNAFILGSFVDKYLYYIPLLENLAYLSSFKTTETVIDRLLSTPGAEVQKTLLLMNLKNGLDFDYIDALFRENPALGSYWLYAVFTRHCFMNDRVFINLLKLQNRLFGYELYPFDNIGSVYFNSTYINPENHTDVRKKINAAICKHFQVININNLSSDNKRPKIAVVSNNWRKDHAVYKCIGAFIESLSEEFDLSLITSVTAKQTDLNSLTDIRVIKRSGSFIDLTPIKTNDFNLVIFPDIGLNIESIILSNIRMAPVQIAMYGHPVSTASREIDRFIVGALAESESPHDCYTETIDVIEGTGMNSIIPPVPRPGTDEKRHCLDGNVINIFISSSLPKINPIIKHYWKRILDTASKEAVLHFLPGDAGFQEVSVFRKEMEAFIGKSRIFIHSQKDEKTYMEIIKHCDFALGSFHYGDYNRVVESLWVGTPFIVIKGHCGYQNTGVAALKALGFNELIVNTLDEYVSMAVSLIHDDIKRAHLQKRVLTAAIENCLVQNTESIRQFRSVVKSLVS